MAEQIISLLAYPLYLLDRSIIKILLFDLDILVKFEQSLRLRRLLQFVSSWPPVTLTGAAGVVELQEFISSS